MVDKSRSSMSVEVHGVWEVYDEYLRYVPGGCCGAFREAIAGRDVSAAWEVHTCCGVFLD